MCKPYIYGENEKRCESNRLKTCKDQEKAWVTSTSTISLIPSGLNSAIPQLWHSAVRMPHPVVSFSAPPMNNKAGWYTRYQHYATAHTRVHADFPDVSQIWKVSLSLSFAKNCSNGMRVATADRLMESALDLRARDEWGTGCAWRWNIRSVSDGYQDTIE